ncbi:MAG: glycosyltransferase family 4 protein [Candidatus Micrarchaeaceae archaeon]
MVGPDILLGSGGAENHSLNVMVELSSNFDFVFVPDPNRTKEYMLNLSKIETKLALLQSKGIKVPDSFKSLISGEISRHEYNKDIFKLKHDLLINFDYLYPLEKPDFTEQLARGGKDVLICLQGLGNFGLRFSDYFSETMKLFITSKGFFVVIYRLYQYFERMKLIRKINKAKWIKRILTVNTFYYENISIRNKDIAILFPGNGITNPGLLDYKPFLNSTKKKNQMIFFARLGYMKGIFELKPIMDLVSKKSDATLIIIGKFEHELERRKFIGIMSNYLDEGRVIYKGYVDDVTLYRDISESKVMIYPSHSDSFPITILQALSMGTPVVAYDIPGLRVYSTLKPIRLVREFDHKSMADEILRFLSIDDTAKLFDDSMKSFIELHNWKNVAMQYKRVLQECLEN